MHVIAISADGSVEAMHNDEFPLTFLGPQTIKRASEIEWDDMDQTWYVKLRTADGRFVRPDANYRDVWSNFKSYNEARDFEVRALNLCRLRSVDPLSETGLCLAHAVRGRGEIDFKNYENDKTA